MNAILGISAYYHDSAAALIGDGKILAAAQEERFSRNKHDARFPRHAVEYCLREAALGIKDLDAVVFYDKPLVKFERLLETYLAHAPRGFRSFVTAMPVWLKDKLFLKATLKRELIALAGNTEHGLPTLLFSDHHRSHAASAFFPSPFERAAVLCLDGVGEWATTSVWLGEGNRLTPKWEIDFPHSLGLLYSAFTYYTGFKVNSGEYKLMGLAPYGEPKYVDLILDRLIDVKDDGTFRLDMRYFNYATGLSMTNKRFDGLFGGSARKPETSPSQREMDIAASIQVVTEEVILKLAKTVHRELDADRLCLAGGVALNCVANGRLLREGPFDGLWIQPAAGDAGGALGAALTAWHEYFGKPRTLPHATNASFNNRQQPAERHGGYNRKSLVCAAPGDAMRGAYLGPRYGNGEITSRLDAIGAVYERLDDDILMPRLAEILAAGNVVGWFQGRMEFGPRALGARSIIGDPRSPEMQSVMNLRIKYRESFRPFAPAIKYDRVNDWFDQETESPYMLLVARVKENRRMPMTEEQTKLFGIDRLNVPRSTIPAVTHVDYSARIQTVHPETNPRFYRLLEDFEAQTGCPVLINTSFNVRGEPIVCTPEDAYRCFMRTEMNYLVLENVLLNKAAQPKWQEAGDWRKEFELD
ncbi:MAG: carbamoyltransferase [Gammaproteobacteria bacterium]|nr:carbamoyltransferase [Gammaproteobacteria bacterium]NNJ84950.1 carbamoyltransferase [Gammaproteobacteria bacterium]